MDIGIKNCYKKQALGKVNELLAIKGPFKKGPYYWSSVCIQSKYLLTPPPLVVCTEFLAIIMTASKVVVSLYTQALAQTHTHEIKGPKQRSHLRPR